MYLLEVVEEMDHEIVLLAIISPPHHFCEVTFKGGPHDTLLEPVISSCPQFCMDGPFLL